MKFFSILKKDLRILVRNRAEMLLLILMPLAFILPISFALGAGDGYGIQRNNHMMSLPVVNYDGGPYANILLSAVGESLRLETDFDPNMLKNLDLAEDPECIPLLAEGSTGGETPIPGTLSAAGAGNAGSPACSAKVVQAMLQRGWRPAALFIPEGFSDSVTAGEPASVELLYDPAGDAVAMQQIEGVVKGAVIKVSLQNQVGAGLSQLNDLAILAPENVRQTVEEESGHAPGPGQEPAIRLVKAVPENYLEGKIPDTYQQTIPGYTVMYVFFIVTSMTTSIHQEKVNGTFRRLLSMPASKVEILGGKMVATILIGLAQVLLLFLVGALVFRLGLGKDPLAFLLLTLALATTAASIGLAISTTRLRGAGVGSLLVISAVLGGCMFPLDLMPPFLHSFSLFVPHSWALNGYQNLLVRGQGIQEVLPQIGVLLGFAALFFIIAVLRFDFDD